MDEVAKNFTLVDFLGIFAPGAALILSVKGYGWHPEAPAREFFGDNIWLLCAYFVILSYLAGHIAEQVGALLEQLLRLFPFWRKLIAKDGDVNSQALSDAYSLHFPNDTYPTDESEKAEAIRRIFHFVQKKERPQRLLIFSAFYTMSRSFTAELILLSFYTWYRSSRRSGVFWIPPWVCVLLTVIFCLRWIRFEQKCMEEACLIFASKDN